MPYIKTKYINMQTEFAPYEFFSTNLLVRDIINHRYDYQYLQKLVVNNLDNPKYAPILLTFISNLDSYISKLINSAVLYCKHEIDRQKVYNIHDLFSSFPYSLCLIKAILDNKAIKHKIKIKFIYKLFNVLITNSYSGYIWASLLENIYRYRKTNSIPIEIISIYFAKTNCNISHKYTITNFIHDDFIQYLTNEEIDKTIPIFLKKENINQWLANIYIPNYIWLISKLAKYLPYSFTKEKLLILAKDPYCSQKALLSMSHLHKEDFNWLNAYYLLKELT